MDPMSFEDVSVVDRVLVRDKHFRLFRESLLNTLLGFEATGPRPLCPFGETGGGGLLLVTGVGKSLVSLHLGGGVWCLICG
jgi:hypothetical protein